MDADAQHAPGFDALEERLGRLGATPAEIAAARARGRLVALAVELLVSPARGLTFGEVAARAGIEEERARRLWRAWGFPDPEPDDRRFADVDVELVQFASAIEKLVGAPAAYHTARVMGIAVGRIAEAEISMIRSAVEAPLRAAGATDDDALTSYEGLVPSALEVADKTLTVLHRHHIVETARRHVDWEVEATPHSVIDACVGFADLTESTRLASALALDELDHALAVFEERTADVLAAAGATLVKRIGDAVMFTTPAAPVAARVAVEIVRAFAGDPVVPPVRVGVAAGRVVARRGDFYGLPVALAARLETLAAPSTVLVDEALAARLEAHDDAWRVVPRGAHPLAGFAQPVPVFELAPVAT